jgi:uncharacterized protein YciI
MKKQFFLKLMPPRQTFLMDMAPEEQAIMQKHVGYWTSLLSDGTVIVFGPVFDQNGGYGAGIVCVDNEDQLKYLISNDPANGLNHYEYFPMMAIFKQN